MHEYPVPVALDSSGPVGRRALAGRWLAGGGGIIWGGPEDAAGRAGGERERRLSRVPQRREADDEEGRPPAKAVS